MRARLRGRPVRVIAQSEESEGGSARPNRARPSGRARYSAADRSGASARRRRTSPSRAIAIGGTADIGRHRVGREWDPLRP